MVVGRVDAHSLVAVDYSCSFLHFPQFRLVDPLGRLQAGEVLWAVEANRNGLLTTSERRRMDRWQGVSEKGGGRTTVSRVNEHSLIAIDYSCRFFVLPPVQVSGSTRETSSWRKALGGISKWDQPSHLISGTIELHGWHACRVRINPMRA
ncbi:hypothetical protein Taro_047123 [Colocasia esculenta]|uniref:Uncharacterized protein n=1 Tax=Colocasia esculenta TaxID=4460 RepID=A0A843WRY8_COLES|nr:hypothetical protein [Colocasia esculenta]